MYPDGRPNRLARLLNRGWAVVHAAGLWPNRLVTLEVPERRTGRTMSYPLVIVDYEGERYLVSMLGKGSNWVRNVEAANGRAVVHAAGVWPNRLVTLEVPDRRTGRAMSYPLVIVGYEGERYLVSMLGKDSNWVPNVQAANGRAILRHGRRETIRLVDVDPRIRAPILRRYLSLAPGPRAFIPVDRRAPVEEFVKIAPEFPVFRVTAVKSGQSTAPG